MTAAPTPVKAPLFGDVALSRGAAALGHIHGMRAYRRCHPQGSLAARSARGATDEVHRHSHACVWMQLHDQRV